MDVHRAGRIHSTGIFPQFPSSSFAAPILLMQHDRQPLPDPFLRASYWTCFACLENTGFCFFKAHELKHTQIITFQESARHRRMVVYFNHAPSYTPFCVSGAQQARNPPASHRWCAGDQNAPAPRQWERKHVKIPPKERGSICGGFYPREQQAATQLLLTRRKGRLGRQLHTKCLDVPWRHRSCLPAQSFVSLSPGLQKSICVFLKVRRHQKYSVCCNTNTGSASVLRNQIKALKAANYAMEDFKNPWKHCSSCLKCPHAGVRIRNGCFNIQYSQGAIPSHQFNFRKKYKNILCLPGELN